MTQFQALEWQRNIYLNGFTGKMPIISPDWMKLEQEFKTAVFKGEAGFL